MQRASGRNHAEALRNEVGIDCPLLFFEEKTVSRKQQFIKKIEKHSDFYSRCLESSSDSVELLLCRAILANRELYRLGVRSFDFEGSYR